MSQNDAQKDLPHPPAPMDQKVDSIGVDSHQREKCSFMNTFYVHYTDVLYTNDKATKWQVHLTS